MLHYYTCEYLTIGLSISGDTYIAVPTRPVSPSDNTHKYNCIYINQCNNHKWAHYMYVRTLYILTTVKRLIKVPF